MIFMENKHILFENMTNATNKYFFACLSIVKGEKNVTEKFVLSIYKDNI